MCWFGKLELKTAEKDIPIFKIMEYKNNKLISCIIKFEYFLNKEYTSEIIPDIKNPSRIQEVSVALHSYSPSVNLNLNGKLLVASYNCITNLIANYHPTIVKVNGIIPKGAIYCENERGEFISDKLILKEITNEIQTIAANNKIFRRK